MAIKQLKKEIIKICTDANNKTRAELSKHKIEAYVYNRKYIKEWARYSCEYLGLEKKGNYINGMVKAFLDSTEQSFKTSNEPFHVSRFKKELTVVKVDRTTASRESGSSSREKKATGAGKEAALKSLEQAAGVSILSGHRTRLKTGMHGHHGGPLTSDPKTTLGMESVRDNMPRSDSGLGDLIDSLNQRTPADTLRDVVVGLFSDVIDAEMQLHNLPNQVMATRNIRTPNPVTKKYVLTRAIQVKFALGSGSTAKGQAYTKAMKEWDEGRGGKLAKKIESILADVENKINSFIIKHMASNSYNQLMIGASPGIIDNVLVETPKLLVKSIFPHKSNPDMRLKVNKALFKKMATPKKASSGFQKPKKKKGGRVKLIRRNGLPPIGGNIRTDALGTNPIALRNLLNDILPQAIAQNMVSPALRFRTGRFANSVRVSNVTQGPRGGNTMIETTYRQDPYETFAPGGKKYTYQRDPERLIKKTVRQVATGMIGTRFGVGVN